MSKRVTRYKRKRNGFMYFRLFVCFGIILSALFLKYSDLPVVDNIQQTINNELKIGEAINTISHLFSSDENTAEVFKEGNTKESKAEMTEDITFEDFYIGTEKNAIEKEVEEARKKTEEEIKRLSVETLSFQMSSEELHDDTKAEIFRIPPPSYCSYEKIDLNFVFRTPLYGVITSKFGYRDHPIIEDASFHTGLDIAAKKGTAIVAFADGKVIDAGKNATYGNYLLIEHKNGIRSFYGHNSKLSVKKGQKVKVGQKVAEVGSTGMSTGPHLHFEVRKDTVRLDPLQFISPETV